VIERILPQSVAVAEEFGDDPTATLYPEERAAIARAAGSRQREFATARMCAHRVRRILAAGLGPAPRRASPAWGSS
jgi:4'-phosphopantetheinyl transferase EntD